MQAKVLCFLFIVASASAALLPPSIGKSIIDAGASFGIQIPDESSASQSSEESKNQPPINIPKFLEDEIRNLVRLGLGSADLVNRLISDFQKWVEDTLHPQKQRPSTTNGPSPRNSAQPSSTASAGPSSTAAPSSSASTSSSAGSEEPTTETATTTSGPRHRRKARDTRDIQDLVSNVIGGSDFTRLLNFTPLGNLTSVLSKVNFTKITKAVPKIPAPQDITQLPVLPGLRENVQYARDLTTRALGGTSDLQTTIQRATETSIHSLDPVGALSNLCYTILHIYYEIAQNSPLFIVGAAVLQDGLLVIGSVIRSVISVVSSDIGKIASMR